MRIIKIIISSLSLFLLVSCSIDLTIKEGVKLKSVGICINYIDEALLQTDVAEDYDSTLKVFIKNFNSEKHPFKFTDCISEEKNSLVIYIESTALVGPGKQALSVITTAVGLVAVPLLMAMADAPLLICFWYLPKNTTNAEVGLSSDISGNYPEMQVRDIKTNPLFGSIESQRIDQMDAFNEYLIELSEEIEDSYMSNL